LPVGHDRRGTQEIKPAMCLYHPPMVVRTELVEGHAVMTTTCCTGGLHQCIYDNGNSQSIMAHVHKTSVLTETHGIISYSYVHNSSITLSLHRKLSTIRKRNYVLFFLSFFLSKFSPRKGMI